MTICLLAFIIMGAVIAIYYNPVAFLGACIVILAVASCGQANADTLRIALVIESAADQTSADVAVRDAAAIYKAQLGIDLVVSRTDVAQVAGDTQAAVLLSKLQEYASQRPSVNATVLLTRRDIHVGATDYAGIATTGPACSADASAIVALRDDGNDGAILAHELLHTLGVPHDAIEGWLMSVGTARSTSTTLSPDSISTVRASGAGACMVDTPATVQALPPGAPSGGGGGFGFGFLCVLALLVMLAKFSPGPW